MAGAKEIKKVRYYIFLRDVFNLSITAFGGPQVHFTMFLDTLVDKRKYITEKELIELHALCQILPGPTSTQTLTAIGFKKGGPNLAYLTLLVWMLPAVTLMTAAAFLILYMEEVSMKMQFTKFIAPMAVGFVAYSAVKIARKVVHSRTGGLLMIVSAALSYQIQSPYLFPVLLLMGGAITAFKFEKQPIEPEKGPLKINWSNFILWGGVLITAALLGAITKFAPIILFENFYRNGSLIFGGGPVLVPYLYGEFVEFKHLLSSQEFLTGFGLVQGVPGPVFSFSSYIGALAMREYGEIGLVAGAIIAALGIFLPGTFLIFFVIRFWEYLKKYRVIKASLEGINAVSSGMVVAAALMLYQPLEGLLINYVIIVLTFIVLMFTKIRSPFLILAGLLAGIIF